VISFFLVETKQDSIKFTILSQVSQKKTNKIHPITFFSRSPTAATAVAEKKNYSIYDKELFSNH